MSAHDAVHAVARLRPDETGATLRRAAVRGLARADAELVAAIGAERPGERFVHAHLAALRAAAALVSARGTTARRGRPRTVWELLAVAAPELAPWSSYFAGGARERSAVESGRDDAVDAERADELLACAEDFRDEVALALDPRAGFVEVPLRVAAS
ncbi:hypothetical protein CLV28_2878 [Sediminihabitans luteus]|uniref:SAV-6107-like HEPN domain-containing protein n=1 Tax=Sediminihabitans luteus TaxID=1138585 RepID=A0A2M9CCK0_9CELL|nr:SAV_6107 family HEPN domain-containing protein [Sediminihabitans luteus]PJJ69069.1 hypothetical protein CLV28_2878 [Sediminihabitans luteus]GII99455.1 hypothetical protein Slu03_18330 [Sediminihabitans luteus]